VAIAVSMNMKAGPKGITVETTREPKLGPHMEKIKNMLESTKQLTIMTLMVWGSPGSFGTEDKEARMKAIGRLPQDHPEVDMFLLTDLWMRGDHDIIKSLIPEEYDITTVNELSLPACDGLIAPEFCSGLTVISKIPFLKVKFYPFDNHGDFFWDYEYFLRRGVGKVQVEVLNKTVEVFVTSLATFSYNYWYREKQAAQLVETVALSEADIIIVGGDLNVDPREDEKVYPTFKKAGLLNVGEEFYKGDKQKWLSENLSTLGNRENSYTSEGDSPVIFDYIFHHGGEVKNFRIPILKTDVSENKTISFSNHEAVMTVICI